MHSTIGTYFVLQKQLSADKNIQMPTHNLKCVNRHNREDTETWKPSIHTSSPDWPLNWCLSGEKNPDNQTSLSLCAARFPCLQKSSHHHWPLTHTLSPSITNWTFTHICTASTDDYASWFQNIALLVLVRQWPKNPLNTVTYANLAIVKLWRAAETVFISVNTGEMMFVSVFTLHYMRG